MIRNTAYSSTLSYKFHYLINFNFFTNCELMQVSIQKFTFNETDISENKELSNLYLIDDKSKIYQTQLMIKDNIIYIERGSI